MKTIYKYELKPCGVQTLALPRGAIIRSCGLDGYDVLCLWAEIETDEEVKEIHQIVAIGTGFVFEAEAGWDYIGTVRQGEYIWHIYEIKRLANETTELD